MGEESTPASRIESAGAAFAYGAQTAATSVFMFVITITYIGFGALIHDYGLSVIWGMLSTVLIWAGPAQVILVTALGSGAGALEGALGVGLSSVRLLPMVVSVLPLLKRETTRAWQLITPVHFIAVSVWVETMRVAPGIRGDQAKLEPAAHQRVAHRLRIELHASIHGLAQVGQQLLAGRQPIRIIVREAFECDACLHAIDYLTKFGYSDIQAYMILGAAPIEGRLSGVVDIPNSCSTVYIPTAIFDFDVTPSARGPFQVQSGPPVPKASF